MNVLQAVRNYVMKMVTVHQGLKALIMDEETVRIVSVAFAKSELLKHECVSTIAAATTSSSSFAAAAAARACH